MGFFFLFIFLNLTHAVEEQRLGGPVINTVASSVPGDLLKFLHGLRPGIELVEENWTGSSDLVWRLRWRLFPCVF